MNTLSGSSRSFMLLYSRMDCSPLFMASSMLRRGTHLSFHHLILVVFASLQETIGKRVEFCLERSIVALPDPIDDLLVGDSANDRCEFEHVEASRRRSFPS